MRTALNLGHLVHYFGEPKVLIAVAVIVAALGGYAWLAKKSA